MRVLSRPGDNDGLIRAWLAWRGWRAPTHVKDNVIWVTDHVRALYLRDALEQTWRDWGNGAEPMPTVKWLRKAAGEVYSCPLEEVK
jgi:hypothetical protein